MHHIGRAIWPSKDVRLVVSNLGMESDPSTRSAGLRQQAKQGCCSSTFLITVARPVPTASGNVGRQHPQSQAATQLVLVQQEVYSPPVREVSRAWQGRAGQAHKQQPPADRSICSCSTCQHHFGPRSILDRAARQLLR